MGKIQEEIYLKTIGRLKSERKDYDEKLKDVDFKLSNLNEYIDLSIKISSNLVNLWRMDNYELKEEIQNLLFPQGIYYDREKDAYRTEKVISALAINAYVADSLSRKQKEKASSDTSFSNLVEDTGLLSNQFIQDLQILCNLNHSLTVTY